MIARNTLRFVAVLAALCAAALLGFGAVMLVAGTFNGSRPTVDPIVLTDDVSPAPPTTTTTAATPVATDATAESTSTSTTSTSTTSIRTATTLSTNGPTLVDPTSTAVSGQSGEPTAPASSAESVGRSPAPSRPVATAAPPPPIVEPVVTTDDDEPDNDEPDNAEPAHDPADGGEAVYGVDDGDD